jgi:hypothetical protein
MIISSALVFGFGARADMFGADVSVLLQILQQNIAQLAQLKAILQSGDDTLDLLREINRGINDSLALAHTLGIHVDPGLYAGIDEAGQALDMVEQVYGTVADSPLATTQRNTDQTVAEAIAFNNDLHEYTQNLDQVGEEIKSYSHQVSPGGAEKLTAESLGVMIHVLNQQIRATGEGLKLQAQALALQNKREKDMTAQYLKEGDVLKTKMMGLNSSFDLPRF